MDLITDALFKSPAVLSAQAFISKEIKTFFYNYDYSHSRHFPSWAGVFHGADLPYVFGYSLNWYNSSANAAEQVEEIRFAKTIMTMWSNFAKNG